MFENFNLFFEWYWWFSARYFTISYIFIHDEKVESISYKSIPISMNKVFLLDLTTLHLLKYMMSNICDTLITHISCGNIIVASDLHSSCILNIMTLVSQLKFGCRFLSTEGMHENSRFKWIAKDGASPGIYLKKSATIKVHSCDVTNIVRRVCVCVCV